MEGDSLIRDSNFTITTNDCQLFVNKWLQRENGDEDLDFFLKKGGEKWLVDELKTDIQLGIDSNSIEDREIYFGSNRKEIAKSKTFWHFVRESADDFLHRVLFAVGVFTIVVDEIMDKDERSTAWIEGFAILLAIFLIVTVSALNNLKKEKEFSKLNKEAEAGKVVTIIRNGVKLIDVNIGEVEVGDLVVVKSGMENPGDAILIEGFSIHMDESSLTGESKPMHKETLQKCLAKRESLFKKNLLDFPCLILRPLNPQLRLLLYLHQSTLPRF